MENFGEKKEQREEDRRTFLQDSGLCFQEKEKPGKEKKRRCDGWIKKGRVNHRVCCRSAPQLFGHA